MATGNPAFEQSNIGQLAVMPPAQTKPLQQTPQTIKQPAVQQSALAGALQQTPGGQWGNIGNYGNQGSNTGSSSGTSFGSRPSNNNTSGSTNNNNATQWNSNFAPVDTGVDNFRQFGDQYYNQMMERNQPLMAQRENQARQSLIDRGLQPGTAAFESEISMLNQSNNDFMNSAAVQAEQLGLQAQNQYFGQESQNNQFGLAQNQQNYGQQFGYDQLANALEQSRIGADASMFGAGASANASMYNAGLNNQLGMAQLASNDRQFDVNNILATNGQNQNYNLGLMGQYNNFMNTGINQFNSQQAANNQWWNQISGATSNAPGINFTPNTGYTNSQIQANQNNMGAIGQDNQMYAGLLGGALASDSRLKENIELVDNVDGVNVYDFDYIDKSYGDGRYRGVMAQEIEADYPDAVVEMGNGFKAVDYSQLPVDMERVA